MELDQKLLLEGIKQEREAKMHIRILEETTKEVVNTPFCENKYGFHIEYVLHIFKAKTCYLLQMSESNWNSFFRKTISQ